MRKIHPDIIEKAKKGDPEALYQLGFAYYTGHGKEIDLEKAVACFKQAASQNHPKSIQALGVCYANGDGVTKDLQKAVFWYRKGAHLNFASSLYNLALCYYRGEGVKQDGQQARQLMEQAALTDKDAKRFMEKVYGVKNKKTFWSWRKK